MTARAYVESRAEEIIKLTASVVYRSVIPLLRTLPPFVKNDPTLSAEDMIMEAAESVLEKADYFDVEKQDAFTTWVCTVAKNYCVNRMISGRMMNKRTPPNNVIASIDKRLRAPNGERSDDTLADIIPFRTDYAGDMVEAETARRIARQINALEVAREREIMWLLVGGESLKKVGERYGIGAERTRQIKEKCLREIRSKLEMEEAEP